MKESIVPEPREMRPKSAGADSTYNVSSLARSGGREDDSQSAQPAIQ